MWIKDIFAKRDDQGDFNNLIEELRSDAASFFGYMRMTQSQFDLLLGEVKSRISKADTNFWKSIELGLKLALTFRFLAAGDSQVSLSYAYRMPKTSVTVAITDVLDALLDCLHEKFLPMRCSVE